MRWTRGLKVSAEMLMAHKLRTVLSLLGIVVGIATVSVMAAVGRGSEQKMDQCAARLRQVLRHRHRLRSKPDDFTIQNQAELLKAQQETQSAFTSLTVGVASLSLAVGGVGILAVMLMSVRERVREIGLRRALGARRGDILFQFLVEAVMLSVSGGILGVLVGIIVTFVVAHFAGWEAILSPQTVLLSVASSVGIGLLFGTIPARKASLASPVASLRAELAFAETQVIQAEQSVKVARAALAQFLDIPSPDLSIEPGPLLQAPPNPNLSVGSLDEHPRVQEQVAAEDEIKARERALE